MVMVMVMVLGTAACRQAGTHQARAEDFARSVIHTAAEYAAAPRLPLRNWRPACLHRNGHCDYRTFSAGGMTPSGGSILVEPGGVLEQFDSAGRYLRSIGRTGFADGEYRGVADLAVDAQGAVVVFDRSNFRLLRYDTLGTLSHALQLRPVELFTSAAVWSGGLVFFSIPTGDSVGQPVPATFDALDPSGRSIHRVATVLAPALNMHSSGDLQPMPPFFMPRASWTVGPDGAITFTNGTSTVERYDTAGHPQLFLQTGVPSRPVTPREIDAEKQRILAMFPVSRIHSMVVLSIDQSAAHAARVHAAFTAVRVLRDGTTWLREQPRGGADSARWDAFRPNGAWLGWVELPASMHLLDGRASRLLLATRARGQPPSPQWVDLAAPEEAMSAEGAVRAADASRRP